MQGLLALRQPPDAVFCYNDMTAIGAIQATLQAGLKIPRDVAIIGCGNFRYADYLQVPLSSIDQDTAELGRAAAQLALSVADSPKARVQSIVLKPKLVIRQSSAAPSVKISR
jgi:LacI family transcriptional regulator